MVNEVPYLIHLRVFDQSEVPNLIHLRVFDSVNYLLKLIHFEPLACFSHPTNFTLVLFK